jgi:DNA-binding winged helix-turn-helix (wHTH) protein/TolB-like protein/Tfp pilus assembly protein PilF
MANTRHPGRDLYEFGPFQLDPTDYLLRRGEEVIQLPPKVFETLLVLVESGGRVVSKEDLMSRLWPDSFVEENSLTQNIFLLRRALSEQGSNELYVKTIPKRGYRFVANVTTIPRGASAVAPEERAEARAPGEEEGSEVRSHSGAEARASRVGAPHHYATGRAALIVAGILLLLAGAYLSLRFRQRPPVSGPAAGSAPVRKLAVLPFRALDSHADDHRLGLGMADAAIIKLGGLREVTVFPTGSVMKFAGGDYDPLEAGRSLGVDAVLCGTVQSSDGRVRVTAQLLHVGSGETLWTGKFDERLTDLFAVQDSISEQIARPLSLRMSETEKRRLTSRPTSDAEAYQDYLLGLNFWGKRSKEGLYKAAEYFSRASERDKNFARSHAALADTYGLIAFRGYGPLHPDEAFSRAKDAVRKALEADPELAEAHATLAMIYFNHERDPVRAYEAYKRAIELDPDSAMTRHRYGLFLMRQGRLGEGLVELRLAQQLDPLSAVINSALCEALYYSRLDDEAAGFCRRALEIEPDLRNVFYKLALMQERKGRYDEALALLDKWRGPDTIDTEWTAARAHILALAGRRADAERAAEELRAVWTRKGEVSPSSVAIIHDALGQRDKATEWMKKAAEARSLGYLNFTYDWRTDRIRSDPEVTALMRRYDLTHLLNPR